MPVACAMVRGRLVIAVVTPFLPGTVIAMETNSMRLEFAVETAPRMQTVMASATMSMTVLVSTMPSACATAAARQTPTAMPSVTMSTPVWGSSTNVGSATARAPYLTAGVQASPPAIATATAINSMPLAFVAAHVLPMRTAMASVTMSTAASER